MPALRVSDVVRATGGKLLRGQPDRTIDSYSIDTRSLRSGALFFALKGTRTDGHAYLADAHRVGAAAAMVQNEPGAEEVQGSVHRRHGKHRKDHDQGTDRRGS